MLRFLILFPSVLSGMLIVIPSLNTLQASPVEESNSQQLEQKTTTPDKATTESKKKKKAASLYETMTQYQLNQVKRYDCRLPKQLISHDCQAHNCQAKTKKTSATAATVKKNTHPTP